MRTYRPSHPRIKEWITGGRINRGLFEWRIFDDATGEIFEFLSCATTPEDAIHTLRHMIGHSGHFLRAERRDPVEIVR